MIHVKCNYGEIRYLYVKISDFEIISDEDNVLNCDEAIVRCITPAFNMTNAKAVIHAVGSNFSVIPIAFKEIFDACYNSLKVLMDNGYHSISFPLISSVIFGGLLANSVAESTKQYFYQDFYTRRL